MTGSFPWKLLTVPVYNSPSWRKIKWKTKINRFQTMNCLNTVIYKEIMCLWANSDSGSNRYRLSRVWARDYTNHFLHSYSAQLFTNCLLKKLKTNRVCWCPATYQTVWCRQTTLAGTSWLITESKTQGASKQLQKQLSLFSASPPKKEASHNKSSLLCFYKVAWRGEKEKEKKNISCVWRHTDDDGSGFVLGIEGAATAPVFHHNLAHVVSL